MLKLILKNNIRVIPTQTQHPNVMATSHLDI